MNSCVREDLIMAYLKLVSQHLSQLTEENHEKIYLWCIGGIEGACGANFA